MEECKYRKMRCNLGHVTEPYPEGIALPRRCPECKQLYDRKFNKPILCYADGSVPKESVEDESNEEIHFADIQVESNNSYVEYDNTDRSRRGRRPSQLETYEVALELSNRRRERQNSPKWGTELGTYEREHLVIQNKSMKKRVLYGGGEKIEIPEYGACLGREELGKEYFYMNQLVSRKHAYVKADNGGNIQVKDAGSLNGTYIDDGTGRRRLKVGETAVLSIGAKIWIANQMLVVEEDNI